MTGAAVEMAGFVWISLFGELDSVGQKNVLNSLLHFSHIHFFLWHYSFFVSFIVFFPRPLLLLSISEWIKI